jgi:hypothetical protein
MAKHFGKYNAAVGARRDLQRFHDAKPQAVIVADQVVCRLRSIQGQPGVAVTACPVFSKFQQSCPNAFALKAGIDTQLANARHPNVSVVFAIGAGVRRVECNRPHDPFAGYRDKTITAGDTLSSDL